MALCGVYRSILILSWIALSLHFPSKVNDKELRNRRGVDVHNDVQMIESNFSVLRGKTSEIPHRKGKELENYTKKLLYLNTTAEMNPLCLDKAMCTTVQPVSGTNASLATLAKIEKYLSMAGVCVNIVSYGLVIVVYGLMRELRTVQSYVLIAVCITLILEESICLVEHLMAYTLWACFVVAICRHWLLLVLLVWLSIMVFELLRLTGLTGSGGEKRFNAYTATAITLPTLVIIFTSVIDKSTEGKLGYGRGLHCGMGNFMSRFLLQVAPLLATILFSMAILIFTIYDVHQNIRLMKRYELPTTKETGKLNITKMALKLVLIICCVELIGFIQLYHVTTEYDRVVNATLRFLYSLLKSGRGFLICTIYVLRNTLVFQLSRDKFRIWVAVILWDRTPVPTLPNWNIEETEL